MDLMHLQWHSRRLREVHRLQFPVLPPPLQLDRHLGPARGQRHLLFPDVPGPALMNSPAFASLLEAPNQQPGFLEEQHMVALLEPPRRRLHH
jgi:hypothetical protein